MVFVGPLLIHSGVQERLGGKSLARAKIMPRTVPVPTPSPPLSTASPLNTACKLVRGPYRILCTLGSVFPQGDTQRTPKLIRAPWRGWKGAVGVFPFPLQIHPC